MHSWQCILLAPSSKEAWGITGGASLVFLLLPHSSAAGIVALPSRWAGVHFPLYAQELLRRKNK